jgi:hypothetical protein
MANVSLIYDPRGHTFDSWAALMCELYAANQLEIPDAKTNWKTWGESLKAIDVFTNEAIPGTIPFNNWLDWAQAVVGAVQPKD